MPPDEMTNELPRGVKSGRSDWRAATTSSRHLRYTASDASIASTAAVSAFERATASSSAWMWRSGSHVLAISAWRAFASPFLRRRM